MLSFFLKKMDELNSSEQHDIFALRSEIFVVEQECIYQDIDGKDKEALHITGKKGNEIVAYARIIESGVSYPDHISIGRLMVKKKHRRKAHGHELLSVCLRFLEEQNPKESIKISAQSYLENFYNNHGFKKQGKGYLEDGIPHIAMIKKDI
jgi:ElaA protein